MLHVTADSSLLWGIKYYTLHSSCHQQNRFHQLTASQEQFLVQASQCGLLGEGQSYAMGNVLWNPVLSCCVILVEVCRFIFEKGLLEKELLMNLQTFSFCNGRKMWWYADSKDLLGYMAVQNLAMKSKVKKLSWHLGQWWCYCWSAALIMHLRAAPLSLLCSSDTKSSKCACDSLFSGLSPS